MPYILIMYMYIYIFYYYSLLIAYPALSPDNQSILSPALQQKYQAYADIEAQVSGNLFNSLLI